MIVALYTIQNTYVSTSMNLCLNSEVLGVYERNTLQPFGTDTQDARRCHMTPVISHTARQPGGGGGGGLTINTVTQTLGSSPPLTNHHLYQGLQVFPSFISRSLPGPVTLLPLRK